MARADLIPIWISCASKHGAVSCTLEAYLASTRRIVTTIQDLVQGLEIGQWTLQKELGRGGNGVVWEARSGSDTASRVAIKFLKKTKQVALQRFKDEVTVVRNLSGYKGILPVLDFDLSSAATLPWFAMPIAIKLEAALHNEPLTQIITQFASLARTLAALHQRKISHRDIKPANLMSYGGDPVVADFGIAKFPGYAEVTMPGNIVGPGPTIAPEMRRKNVRPSPYPADVFSLAKSLWMILTGRPEGFDGEYSATQRRMLNLARPKEHLGPLHGILAKATAHEPADRPDASTLAGELEKWVEVTSDIERRAPDEWLAVETDLFPYGIPASAEWSDVESIRVVLDRIASSPVASHTMLPGGGGLTISGADPGRSPGTIELDFETQSTVVVSPRQLQFRRVDQDRASDFFILVANPLALPSGYETVPSGYLADFTQLPDGRLIAPTASERGEWGGRPLAAGSRAVTLCLGGTFLLLMRRSRYNKTPATYNGMHGEFTADELARALTGTPSPQPGPLAAGGAYEVEDRSWLRDPALRPVLRHLTVKQVLVLIRKWPRHRFRKDLGVDFWEFSADDFVRANEEHTARDLVISKLLETFTDDALRELVALMYVGRDHRSDPLSLARWERFTRAHADERPECIRVLSEKTATAKYLAWGLRTIGAYRLRI